ncbi:MAG: hypothetical protein HUJ68_05995 [Clostridia bacterium]|nr:hypothetical protein [Clostridia bacterium]
MNEKMYKSVTVLLGVIMLLIQAIGLIYIAGINPEAYDFEQKIIHSIAASIESLLLIIFMAVTLKKNKFGPVLGMVIGLVYTYQFTIFSLLVGVTFFAFSLGLLVELMKENEKEEEKKTSKKETEEKEDKKEETAEA